uniref:Uncharacterized protein n=1 Tax=Amphimedon queenslandica TaxID=400682 RepID=A0A1X7V2L7_AMPQE
MENPENKQPRIYPDLRNDDAQTIKSFARAASKSLEFLQWAFIPERMWCLFVLNMAKEYQRSSRFKQKILVSRVGKQPESDVWVLSPNVQISSKGKLIATEKKKYFWYDKYMTSFTNKPKVTAIPIVTPLSIDPLIELLTVAKSCLKNNFISSFLTVAGAAVILHYESILEFQDECPLVLCHSSAPGAVITEIYRKVDILKKCP